LTAYLPYGGLVALVVAAFILVHLTKSVVAWCLVISSSAGLCAEGYFIVCGYGTYDHTWLITAMLAAQRVASLVSAICLVWSMLILRQRMLTMSEELARSRSGMSGER
jgi:hypothetical protein